MSITDFQFGFLAGFGSNFVLMTLGLFALAWFETANEGGRG